MIVSVEVKSVQTVLLVVPVPKGMKNSRVAGLSVPDMDLVGSGAAEVTGNLIFSISFRQLFGQILELVSFGETGFKVFLLVDTSERVMAAGEKIFRSKIKRLNDIKASKIMMMR